MMDPLLQALVQGVVGFAIGAGTNDLAIRWVFRAIFAKKKPQIALAVQRVISQELMSPEKIAAHLSSPEVAETLRGDILGLLDELAAKDYPPLASLAAGGADRAALDEAEGLLAASLTEAACRQLGSEDFRATTLRSLADGLWGTCSPKPPRELLPDSAQAALRELPRRLVAALFAEERRGSLAGALAEGVGVWMRTYPTPRDLLGEANAELAARLIAGHASFLAGELAVVLAEPEAQKLLTEALGMAARKRLESIGALGSLFSGLMGFAPVEEQLAKFAASLPAAIREQAGAGPGGERLAELAGTAARRLLARPWGELFDFASPEKLRALIEGILAEPAIRPLLEQASERLVGMVNESLEEVPLGKLAEATLGADGIGAWTRAAVETACGALAAPEARPRLEAGARDFIGRLCALPIGRPERFVARPARERLAALLAGQVTGFIRLHTAEMLERSHFWDVVYDSITVYDEHKMEAVTRSVANHELWGVTLMGGVIGFIVGIAQGALLWLWDKL